MSIKAYVTRPTFNEAEIRPGDLAIVTPTNNRDVKRHPIRATQNFAGWRGFVLNCTPIALTICTYGEDGQDTVTIPIGDASGYDITIFAPWRTVGGMANFRKLLDPSLTGKEKIDDLLGNSND